MIDTFSVIQKQVQMHINLELMITLESWYYLIITMEFSIVEGKKLNSINFMSDGYRYNKYNQSNGTIYLRCTLARSHGCSATAKILDAGNNLIITKTHNHSQTEHQTDTIILANRIKRVA